MPLQATSGAASYDAFGGGAAAVPQYIEEVFSTWLYTGVGGTQTITNGIDLSGKGGLVWIKPRSVADWHNLYDTARGASKSLATNATDVQYDLAGNGVSAFGSTGFTINGSNDQYNTNGVTYASWTFREQPKFFDVVTYTGTGSNTTIAHNLGSVPGSIIVKRTDTAAAWAVYHRSLANTQYLVLNTTAAAATGATRWNSTTPTSTEFSLGTDATVNASGGTYVAYLFAHDAGGFGLTGTDNVISCGTFTTNGSGNATVTLGYEPQLILFKATDVGANWEIFDNVRGMPVEGTGQSIYANSSAAETARDKVHPTATGFTNNQGGAYSFIYIAIRRGPMKVPTDATKVFEPVAITGDSTSRVVTNSANFPIDAVLIAVRGAPDNKILGPRLTGEPHLLTNDSAAETLSDFPSNPYPYMNGILVDGTGGTNQTGNTYVYEMLRRAPSFMDVVCYTGTGANTTQTHNLSVVPQLIIVKGRSAATAWQIYSSALANTEYLVLNTTAAKATGATRWNSTTPTSTVFSIGTASEVNTSAETYVAYLFATCSGVSKVFSYTGNGSSQTINCGFTGGARFVLIKRTNTTGDWYVWDTARGIVAGNDPHLSLNNAVAEVTTNDTIDTDSTGFVVNQVAATNVNVTSATYIGLAIA
jgi:hypothetical protein